MAEVEAGQRISWTRLITEEDIARFAEISGDKGAHHLQKDESGRLMAHGLLTATLPTKIGGDVDYMAKSISFEFLKAVYSGDRLTCDGIVGSVIKQKSRLKLKFLFTVTNQHGEVVLKGESAGQILRR